MSAGQTPSGSEFQEWMKIGGAAGAATVGTNSIMHNHAKGRHDRILREQKRGEALHKRLMTANQYVLYGSQDGRSHRQIKEGLLACGGIHEGHNFSLAESFDVVETNTSSSDPIKWALDFPDPSCRLVLYPTNTSPPNISPPNSGGSSGDTPDTPTVLNDGGEVGTEKYQYLNNMFLKEYPYSENMSDNMPLEEYQEGHYSPNLSNNVSSNEYRYIPNMSHEVSEVSQEYYQGRPVKHTFTATRNYTTPDGVYYGIAIALALVGSLMFDSIKRIFQEWISSEDSKESAKVLEESGSGRPQVDGKELEAGEGSPTTINVIDTKATAELMLEIFVCYKKGAITKGGAICLLTTYYNLSQAEALQVLEEE